MAKGSQVRKIHIRSQLRYYGWARGWILYITSRTFLLDYHLSLCHHISRCMDIITIVCGYRIRNRSCRAMIIALKGDMVLDIVTTVLCVGTELETGVVEPWLIALKGDMVYGTLIYMSKKCISYGMKANKCLVRESSVNSSPSYYPPLALEVNFGWPNSWLSRISQLPRSPNLTSRLTLALNLALASKALASKAQPKGQSTHHDPNYWIMDQSSLILDSALQFHSKNPWRERARVHVCMCNYSNQPESGSSVINRAVIIISLSLSKLKRRDTIAGPSFEG